MAQKNKFDSNEKRRIEELLDLLYPNKSIILREGNSKLKEPDGIINIQNAIIGIEVTRVELSNQLLRENAYSKIREHLNESLSSLLPSNFQIQIDGNTIPLYSKEIENFNIIASEK